MAAACASQPRVVRAMRGRARVHLAGWSGAHAGALERRVRALAGVLSAEANPLTGNILIRYDAAELDEPGLVAALAGIDPEQPGQPNAEPARTSQPAPPASFREARGSRRLRIAVRGLDRDAGLARRVVERLERRPDVARAVASPLTGRVLVELGDLEVDLEGLLAELTGLELPELPGEDVPHHPLDPAPLIQSTARVIGSALGLGLFALRRVVAAEGAPVSAAGPAAVAGAVGIVEGLPPLQRPVEGVLGRDRAQLLFGALTIASLTVSGGALGLAVAGAGALGLMTEVRARRAAWRAYEERLGRQARAHPGVVLRLDPGDRVPLPGEALEGFGRAVGPDGITLPVAPGRRLPAGARIYGAGVTVRLGREPPFAVTGRRHAAAPSPDARYLQLIVPASLAFGVLLGVLRRSASWGFTGLLLVNPRAALIGSEHADNRASARVLRSGVTVVGTRRRPLRRPDAVLLGCPRVLTDGLEVASVAPLDDDGDRGRLLELAAAIAGAAGSPWGPAFHAAGRVEGVDGTFDGSVASAEIDGARWTLRVADDSGPPAAAEIRRQGGEPLLLARQGGGPPAAVVAIRPRLAVAIRDLRATCARRATHLAVVAKTPSPAAAAVARRAGVPLLTGAPLHARVDEYQRDGAIVAVVADGPDAGEAFAVADLAVAVASGRSGPFLARADLLTPTLAAVADIVEAGARRDAAVRDAVVLSLGANAAGAAWGMGGAPGVRHGSDATYVGALAAIASGGLRLRGGRRPRSVAERLVDPLPERWGRMSPADALRALGSRSSGLTQAEARERWRPPPPLAERRGFTTAILDQVRSPLIAALAVGAGLSLALGAIADVAMIGAVIVANAAIGAWQEGAAGRAARALERMTARSSTVVRAGEQQVVPATEIVPGDVLVLAPGARVPADARLLEADMLEVDEAALTGESLPVAKTVNGGTDARRVVLEGSDVVAGTGRAVIVATNAETRMGALAAALALHEPTHSPLDTRLEAILRQALPLIAIATGVVVVSGVLWGNPLLPQLALGASAAIAAVPEGLPLLAGVSGAAVARRLASRKALVRRLAAVESLGRVDVACADKTGTLTEGRLAVRVVAGPDGPGAAPEHVDAALADVLLAAALASPHPDAADARSHPTDVAVVEGAHRAGLAGRLRAQRAAELPFEPSRGFHAALVDGRVVVKGAAEAVVPRCAAVRRGSAVSPLREGEDQALLARAEQLAGDGLRVLLAAEGAAERAQDPQGLVALGFIGIADPLRAGVPGAVRRCHEAGVRVVMLTGDHPATARAIAREADLPVDGDAVLTGAEVAALADDELDARLDRARVVARITPLDKVRILEALQRRGHVVAMTGDGVNDAPALRLADVGVAMGRGGTEVAREAADLVLADDDFSTMVEALVEGRGLWANLRRSLALLLGGNLGELALIVGASVAGLPAPLTTRQLLAVNLVTDVLPALAVAVQEPEHRNLSGLAREGASGLDAPLRADILRRGVATAVPSLGAYLVARQITDPLRARSVAFASIIATQLGHTVDLGRVEGRLSAPVIGAVGASAGLTAAALALPGLQSFLGLAVPGPLGLAIVLAATVGAVAIARALSPAAPAAQPPSLLAP